MKRMFSCFPHSIEWKYNNQHQVQPINMLVPVTKCPWLIGNMGFPSIFLTFGLILLCQSHLFHWVFRDLVSSNIDKRLCSHQTTTHTCRHNSRGLAVGASSQSVQFGDVYRINTFRHDDWQLCGTCAAFISSVIMQASNENVGTASGSQKQFRPFWVIRGRRTWSNNTMAQATRGSCRGANQRLLTSDHLCSDMWKPKPALSQDHHL